MDDEQTDENTTPPDHDADPNPEKEDIFQVYGATIFNKGGKFDPVAVAEALRINRGLIHLTARYLRTDHTTILGYVKRHAIVRDTLASIRGEIVDVTEWKLMDNVGTGDQRAVEFLLKQKAKDRGYGDTVTVNGSIQNHVTIDFSGISTEELKKLASQT